MDFKTWIENVEGMASVYAFDVLPDGSFSEIRLMAYNSQNGFMMHLPPEAPKFYPGIPYSAYFTDINFESFVYRAASRHEPLYSYVNARGGWIKGFYLPITEAGTVSADVVTQYDKSKPYTLYCLYTVSYSQEVDSDSMNQRSNDVSNAVMNISIRLHETQDFYQSMAMTSSEIREICGAEKCSIYTVDKKTKNCCFINNEGVRKELIESFSVEMKRTPYEIALKWEEDLAMSDCLLLDDLKVVEERDPLWYNSLCTHGIKNIILYAIRFNQTLVGFIWAANYDTEKKMLIKETLELTTFMIAAVIANFQLVSQLEEKSTIDALTQVNNRNYMNERVEKYVSGEEKLPEIMGIVFADLNGLKTVNDDFGHDAGDKLLNRAAALLKIAFGDYEIYRAGGDEFVIFCPGITEEDLAQQVSQLRALSDNTSDVSFAVGTAYRTGEYDICRAMQSADEQMYKDKEEFYRDHPEKDRRRRSRG